MVLDAFAHAVTTLRPSPYFVPLCVGSVGILAAHALSQGRKTTRERDLHARVVIVSGAFTPLGLTLVQALAERGAHIIALAPEPITSPRIDLIVDALRARTNNAQIFAEHCDLTSPRAVREFCTKFLTGQDTRIDALVFAHEYAHVGAFLPRPSAEDMDEDERRRTDGALTSFLMITLLLPVLLVAPTERDIRVVSIVNPFYAAAAPSFTPDAAFNSPASASVFLREGRRALRTAVLMRHLQRVLDALPNRAQAPATDAAQTAVPVVPGEQQRSNIVALAVSPGASRSDTVARVLGAVSDAPRASRFGFFLYILLQPLLFIFVKSSRSAIQSILHALFLPTPYKTPISDADAAPSAPPTRSAALRDEVLKPGVLYAECAVVRVHVPPLAVIPESPGEKGKEKEDGDERPTMAEDGELGGVGVGTAVWEHFERALKDWEAREPPAIVVEDEPTVDAGESSTDASQPAVNADPTPT